jgi:histidyl-tRNA synthetase
MEPRRRLEALLRRVAARWGYREIQTPAFEELALFTSRSGAEIVRSLYAFRDKDGRDLTLRPELTAPAIRFYLAERSRDPKPLRWFYFGPCYRYEEPQKNRYREFWQFGVEVIGAPLREAEAEILGLAWAMLEEADVEGAEVRLGHVGFLKHYLKGLDADARGRALRALDKGDFAAARKEWEGASALEGSPSFAEVEKRLGPNPFRKEVEALKGALEPHRVRYREVPSIVRGLDYYTGPVFEIHVPRLGAQSQVCGGGSYRLEVGGQEAESTGFAFGFDRLLAASSLPEARGVRVVVCSTPGARAEALRVARELRRHVAAETDLLGRSLGKQLEHAAASGATHAAIVGEREAKEGKVTLKDLKAGTQRTLTLEEAARSLREAPP